MMQFYSGPPIHFLSGIDNQDRNVKAECLNAIGELEKLLLAVLTGISRIRLDLTNVSVDDVEPLLAASTPITSLIHKQIPEIGDAAVCFSASSVSQSKDYLLFYLRSLRGNYMGFGKVSQLVTRYRLTSVQRGASTSGLLRR